MQQGIGKPKDLTTALSIRTAYSKAAAPPPYPDAQGPDGLLRYMWRGTDPRHDENITCRTAMRERRPPVDVELLLPARP